MIEDKHKQIYDNIKNIAKDYKIEILIPTAKKHDVILDSSVLPPINRMADNVLLVMFNNNPSGNLQTKVIKNRMPCEITELIKSNKPLELEKYLERLYKDVEADTNKNRYHYKFLTNFAYLLENKIENGAIFFDILENCTFFKKEFNNNNFWVKLAFEADNYKFLRKKVIIKDIINHEGLIDLIKSAKTTNIVEELLKEDVFIESLENNLTLNQILRKNNFNEKDEPLEIILTKINLKKKIDFYASYKKYVLSDDSINKDSLMYQHFNKGMKLFICYSNYQFTKQDESLEVFNEENQQLIAKKRLNHNLHQKFVEKEVIKRMKI